MIAFNVSVFAGMFAKRYAFLVSHFLSALTATKVEYSQVVVLWVVK